MDGAVHPDVWALSMKASGGITTAGSRAVGWRTAHEQLRRVGKRRAALAAEEAFWLVASERLGAHHELGYGSFVEYAAAVTGRDKHAAHERLRVARALVKLPALFATLLAGETSWSAAREITRVATAETEGAWLDACRDARVDAVQRMVSGRRPGDLPTTPPDDAARTHVVRFEVQGSTLALLRQAQDEYRRRTGGSVDDDALLASMVQAFVTAGAGAGDGDAARAVGPAAQVMVTLCPECREATADAGGDRVRLSPAERDTLCCDAAVLPVARTEPVLGARRSQPGPAPAAERATTSQPGPAPAAEPETSQLRHRPSLDDIDRRAGRRITTAIPRSVRVAVLRRHGGRCAVPGCNASAYLHLHHSRPRSEGGTHDPSLLCPLCPAHHRAVHAGKLVVTGSGAEGFTFCHADGTPYGMATPPDPGRASLAETAFRALCVLGFGQTESRRAVDGIRGRIEPDMTNEQVVRMALAATQQPRAERRVGRACELLAVYLPSWAA